MSEHPQLEGGVNPTSGDSPKDLDAHIPEEIKVLLEGVPEPQQKALQALLIAFSVRKSSFRSPIPPPDILREYNEVIPNGADRILSMTERQSDHRMRMESETVKEEQRQSSKGQTLGFIIGIVGLLIAGACAYFGHDAVAGVIGSVDLVGLVGIFVIGQYYQSKDLKEKNE